MTHSQKISALRFYRNDRIIENCPSLSIEAIAIDAKELSKQMKRTQTLLNNLTNEIRRRIAWTR